MKAQGVWAKAFVVVFIGLLLATGYAGGLYAKVSAANDAVDVAEGRINAANSSVSYWLDLAKNAWSYFQPGKGVDATTGVNYATTTYQHITDWDTGAYIQAIVDAEKLGILNAAGPWGADDRLDRMLSFLENRPLMANGLPYLVYSAQTLQNVGSEQQVATDAGKLFVALRNLADYKPDLKNRVDSIVYNRTNYEPRRVSVDILLEQMLNGVRAPNVYDYYVTCGFAGFWPERFSAKADGILDVIVSSPTVDYEGVVLPKAKLSCEPLLLSVFDFVQPDARLLSLTRQVYLAHEARYNATGKYVAFGEGSTGLSDITFVYEWVMMPDGRMWIVQVVEANDVNNVEVLVSPIVYLKATVGFLAIYNTPYALNMTNYVMSQLPAPSCGYREGIDENGRTVTVISAIANGLMLSAARYAIDNNVSVPVSAPTPKPTSTPIIPNQTPITTPTPIVTPNSTSSPTQTPESLEPNISPSPTQIPSPSPTPALTTTSSTPTPATDSSANDPPPLSTPKPSPSSDIALRSYLPPTEPIFILGVCGGVGSLLLLLLSTRLRKNI